MSLTKAQQCEIALAALLVQFGAELRWEKTARDYCPKVKIISQTDNSSRQLEVLNIIFPAQHYEALIYNPKSEAKNNAL